MTDTPSAVDWAQPWFAPLAPWGQPVLAAWQAGRTVADALSTAPPSSAGVPPSVGFVGQHHLPAGRAYEQFIAEQRRVPTRDNAHDFFNGLVWHALPRAKARMNALQAAEIARDGVQARRGAVRDALTVLDENGALLSAPAPLWQALADRRWSDVFGTLRPLWGSVHLWLLGHAALEKLLAPYKSITVHVLYAPPGLTTLDVADAWLAAHLDAERLRAKPFAPLPVLGVPGWWAANGDAAFYDDATVFRPLRAQMRRFCYLNYSFLCKMEQP
ncbi:DUF3025 domain-containing protein [Ottowia sp.]|uniref:DUF3025 domain-containing protein n=1 Tax=Ottowia sp. TaxID=1898956 RepID=UPI003A84FADE